MSAFMKDLFEDVGSDLTSTTYFVGDAEDMTLQAVAGSATTIIVHASNDKGFSADPTSWSTITTVTAVATATIFDVDQGFRWLRCVRESAVSWTAANLAGRNTTRRA